MSFSVLLRIPFLSVFLLASPAVFAQQKLEFQGPIHEAFLPGIGKDLILEAISETPPRPIYETKTQSTDSEKKWIRGYWDWNQDEEKFVWVCGIWRKPPADHEWIEGYWKQVDEGWTRIPGFWSILPLSSVTYLSSAPPKDYDEEIGQPPSNEYFWVQGYWEYDQKSNRYLWNKGKWEQFQKDFVLVPAHYIWREEGYVFIPAYWDWPLGEIGEAYYPAESPADGFTPSQMIKHPDLFAYYFCYYPYYVSYFCHHFHFHPGFWNYWCCAPNWYWWDSWWSLPAWAHWEMWWWWGHPGTLCPEWVEPWALWINEPNPLLFSWLSTLCSPLFITPSGVVPPQNLATAIIKTQETDAPIFPTDSDVQKAIFAKIQLAKPSDSEKIRPGGKAIGRKGPAKPWIEQEQTPLLSSNSNVVPPIPELGQIAGVAASESQLSHEASEDQIRQHTQPYKLRGRRGSSRAFASHPHRRPQPPGGGKRQPPHRQRFQQEDSSPQLPPSSKPNSGSVITVDDPGFVYDQKRPYNRRIGPRNQPPQCKTANRSR